MSARGVTLVLAGAIACGGPRPAPLAPAGEDKDDGAGALARASWRLHTSDDKEPGFITVSGRVRPRGFGGDMYGGDPYGGFGGSPYGGTGYAGWAPPQWTYAAPNRTPRYAVRAGLTGAVEGAVTWTGRVPGLETSACGSIANPTLRLGENRGVRGVIVYIDKVRVARSTPYYTRPASVGGLLAKRGCALVPAAQIVAPLPGSLAIHGDAVRTSVRVTPVTGTPRAYALEEGGLVQVEIKPGVTRVEGEDGRLAAAWVIGLETPYYAITDDAGRYRIDELAPGTYELTFWQPPLATARRGGSWSYGAPIVVRRSIKVGTKAVPLSIRLPPR